MWQTIKNILAVLGALDIICMIPLAIAVIISEIRDRRNGYVDED